MKIKDKILLAILFISAVLLIFLTGINVIMTRMMLSSNSIELSNNFVTQISSSIDDRINSFEDTVYTLTKQEKMLQLQKERKQDLSYPVLGNKNYFHDAILQSPMIYKYTRYAVMETIPGDLYIYTKRESKNLAFEYPRVEIEEALETVNQLSPKKWFRINDEIVYILLIIDDKTFEIKGHICFFIDESFLNFTSNSRYSSLNQQFIILNDTEDILISGNYSGEDPAIVNLITSLPRRDDVSNHTISYRQHKVFVSERLTPEENWRIICFTDAQVLFRREKTAVLLNVLVAIVIFSFSVILTIKISNGIIINVNEIHKSIENVEKGDFAVRIQPPCLDEVGLLGLRFNEMVEQIDELIHSVARERQAKQEAEFKVLQAQINPHFLYNSLGSVKWIANRKGQDDIEKMLDSIIHLLRGSIKNSNSFQMLSEEIEYIRNYILLQKMRYGDAFHMEYLIEEKTAKAIVPGFLLQPLIENALYHGLDFLKEDGLITIRAVEEHKNLVLQVIDNGGGMEEGILEKILSHNSGKEKYKGFNSLGIRSIYERLKILYGDGATFLMYNNEDRGITVEIKIPLTFDREALSRRIYD